MSQCLNVNTVLIPAAGSQQRWGYALPKQLAWWGRERVIERLTRQLCEREIMPVVITANPAIDESIGTLATVQQPDNNATLCATLLGTKELWNGRVVVLLGDVVASDEALDYILECQSAPMLYGSQNEIFALVFDEPQYSAIAGCLYDANEQAKQGQGNGKLRDFFRLLVSREDTLKKSGAPTNTLFSYVDYFINDIDDRSTYERLLKVMDLSAQYADLQFKLWQMGEDWDLSEDDGHLPLDEFAAEDTIGGYHEHGGEWPMGSVWAVDGMALYALIRALRPSNVYEIGVARGCSSTHILSALEKNQKGRLLSADPAGPGDLVPMDMRERWHFWHERGQDILGNVGKSIKWPDGRSRKLPQPDFIWDDGSHGQQDVAEIATFALQNLKPGGMLAVHDAAHFLVGQDIQNGLKQAGINDFEVYHILPSDCGIALWRKPKA